MTRREEEERVRREINERVQFYGEKEDLFWKRLLGEDERISYGEFRARLMKTGIEYKKAGKLVKFCDPSNGGRIVLDKVLGFLKREEGEGGRREGERRGRGGGEEEEKSSSKIIWLRSSMEEGGG